MKKFICSLLLFVSFSNAFAQASRLDSLLPVRGLAIAAPAPASINSFIDFINTELAPKNINTLILRVDYNFDFKTHPELRDSVHLKLSDVKRIVAAARKANIRIIPQINLLGHQSWRSKEGNLLVHYPQFDETPHVKMPEVYEWPNPDGLYCKSYCPQHPDVHKVVFALVDELCEAFEADAFHAGLDEVFFIGDDRCPRCKGRDKAELFAAEVTKIRNHLHDSGRELWIWGDRLIDGAATGIGMWEASMNNTHRAIDMIPKDIVICDWHYERADKTAVYFAMKGFPVVTCPWRNPVLAKIQLQDMLSFRTESTAQMNKKFQGMVLTVWSGFESFYKELKSSQPRRDSTGLSPEQTFKTLFAEINKLQ